MLAGLPVWAVVYVGVLGHQAPQAELNKLGERTYSQRCAACHGRAGQGGVAPALNHPGLLDSFPDFDSHLQFVTEGSRRGEPYGTHRTIATGNMPGFGPELSAAELEAVVHYERDVLAG